MTSALPSRGHVALRIGLFSVLTTLVALACTRVHYLYPKNIQGFTLPSGCPAGNPPANSPQLSACLTGIEFDTSEFVGDEQRLMLRAHADSGTGLPCYGDSTHVCRYGPLAKVEPVKGVEMYSDDALGQGRIIARIYLRATETDSYPKFNLIPGDTTYWWVNTALDTSRFIRKTGGVDMLADSGRSLTRTSHPMGAFQQALVRWVWDPIDETLNGGCGGSCCKPR